MFGVITLGFKKKNRILIQILYHKGIEFLFLVCLRVRVHVKLKHGFKHQHHSFDNNIFCLFLKLFYFTCFFVHYMACTI